MTRILNLLKQNSETLTVIFLAAVTVSTVFYVIFTRSSEALTVIFPAVVTLSTVSYVILTYFLLSETRKLREVQTEPKIHITPDSPDFAIRFIRLNIKNIGLGPACDLQFTPSVISGGDSAKKLLNELTKSNFFNIGLRHFSPGQNKYSAYTAPTEDELASVLSFKIDYKSATGKKYSDEITLDMRELKSDYQLGTPDLYAIAQSLEKIQKDFGHIVSGSKRVKTDIYSSEDRRAEREEREKLFVEQIKQSENS